MRSIGPIEDNQIVSYVQVVEGADFDLRKVDPTYCAGLEKERADEIERELGKKLSDLTELLCAAASNALLIVVQGRDTAGKDGLINGILEHINVPYCSVASFKVPTPIELAHDFLWRIHAATPGKGSIGIFNRSHYEDVLVVRVHEIVPEAVWRKRYDMINHFEHLLAESGVIIVKFMLDITKDEQEKRLLAREQEVEKAWKLNVGDWKEREHWDEYTEAYQEALRQCSPAHARWHVVPANKKWFRDLAVMQTLVDVLEPYRDKWLAKLQKVGEEAKAALLEYRSGSTAK